MKEYKHLFTNTDLYHCPSNLSDVIAKILRIYQQMNAILSTIKTHQ